MCPTVTPEKLLLFSSREAAQMPASATSKWGLGREVRASLLRVRIGPECPEDNLRDVT